MTQIVCFTSYQNGLYRYTHPQNRRVDRRCFYKATPVIITSTCISVRQINQRYVVLDAWFWNLKNVQTKLLRFRWRHTRNFLKMMKTYWDNPTSTQSNFNSGWGYMVIGLKPPPPQTFKNRVIWKTFLVQMF